MKNVTLVCMDTKYKYESLKVLKNQSKLFDFGRVLFFSNGIKDIDVEIVEIPDLVGKKGGYSYSNFCLKELPKFINTEYCLVIQHDGFIINPKSWTDSFLRYDYIGAPWPDNYLNRVGNGGFSLRSKKFLNACREVFEDVDIDEHEDLLACVHKYNDMVARGVQFAPPEIASQFSVEHWTKEHSQTGYTFPTFGFHGDFTYIGRKAINENNNNFSLQSPKLH